MVWEKQEELTEYKQPLRKQNVGVCQREPQRTSTSADNQQMLCSQELSLQSACTCNREHGISHHLVKSLQ